MHESRERERETESVVSCNEVLKKERNVSKRESVCVLVISAF